MREAAVAGSFYPGGEAALRKSVREYLDAATPPRLEGRLVGLISPHAGYAYSGKTAAYGYRALKGSGFTRVVILAPSHRVGFRGVALTGADAYRTPLGTIRIDREAVDALRGRKLFLDLPGAHEDEHSLEVQLPFLQEVLGEFTLVPLVVGQLSGDDYRVIAEPLKGLLDTSAGTILIASSDFTHYGESFDYVPFRDNVKENLRTLDLGAAELIGRLDAPGFIAYERKTGATICGRCPIEILLAALPEGSRGTLLKYETSGDSTGDFQHTVSYVSMAFTAP